MTVCHRTWQDNVRALHIMGINNFHFVSQQGVVFRQRQWIGAQGDCVRCKEARSITTNWDSGWWENGKEWMCWPKHHQPNNTTCEFWIWMVPGGSACVNTCPCDVTMATGWYKVPPEEIICCHENQVASAATGSHNQHYHQSLINFLSAKQTNTRQTSDKIIKFKVH